MEQAKYSSRYYKQGAGEHGHMPGIPVHNHVNYHLLKHNKNIQVSTLPEAIWLISLTIYMPA